MSDAFMPTFRSPDFSLFQSAVDEALRTTEAPAVPAKTRTRKVGLRETPAAAAREAPAAPPPGERAARAVDLGLLELAQQVVPPEALPHELQPEASPQARKRATRKRAAPPGPGLRAAPPAPAPGAPKAGPPPECLRLAWDLAQARVRRDRDEVRRIEDDLNSSTCDARFVTECAEAYARWKLSLRRLRYVRHRRLSDFVIDLGTDRVKAAVIGDWGTGARPAELVLEAARDQKPDLLVHLGDIYYSGTEAEVEEKFDRVVDRVFGPPSRRRVKIFNLAGNHDMYSGGIGYYGLLQRIGQPASYFCLRTPHWQLLGMDTGRHDASPVGHAVTRLEESEAKWHLDKIRNAGGRRTIALSHHQLFTIEGVLGQTADGKPSGLNPLLYGQLQSVLRDISLWLWGHEHNLIIYDPWPTGGGRTPLEKGRCLGASAVPVFKSQKVYDVHSRLVDFPDISRSPRLATGAECYDHAFAMLHLEGPAGRVEYWRVPHGTNRANLLHQESI